LSDTGKRFEGSSSDISKSALDKTQYYYIGDEAFNPEYA